MIRCERFLFFELIMIMIGWFVSLSLGSEMLLLLLRLRMNIFCFLNFLSCVVRLVVSVIGICVVVFVFVFYVVEFMLVEWCCGRMILCLLNVVVEWMMVLRLCGLVMLLSVMNSGILFLLMICFSRFCGCVYL